ncbi:importin subunit alpha-4-like isoform X1 [Artemia franciscana]|uniref:importin subunit alpha-4-like isoform X1 n=1 Tax=Artemia franciscana TaxID=6661 RepID=UPI0032DAB2CC
MWIPVLVEFVKSSTPMIWEKAVLILGNIILYDMEEKGNYDLRDIIIKNGFLDYISCWTFDLWNILISSKRVLARFIYNMFKIKPHCIDYVEELLPSLDVLLQSNDIPTIIEAVWTLNNLSTVVEDEVLKSIVPLLAHSDVEIVTAVLKTLRPGRVWSFSTFREKHLGESGFFFYLHILLQHQDKKIIQEALLTLENLLQYGSQTAAQGVADAQLLQFIVSHLDTVELQIQKTAASVVTNLTSKMMYGGRHSRYWEAALLRDGLVPHICRSLNVENSEVIKIILHSVHNLLLSHFERDVCLQIKKCGGIDKIQSLQKHEDTTINQLASKVIESYFSNLDVEKVVKVRGNSEESISCRVEEYNSHENLFTDSEMVALMKVVGDIPIHADSRRPSASCRKCGLLLLILLTFDLSY